MKKTLLFCCTGNTCRSPMAVAVMKYIILKKGILSFKDIQNLEIDSRGLKNGEEKKSEISANGVKKFIEKENFDIKNEEITAIIKECENHIAKQLTSQDIESANLIIILAEKAKYINHLERLKSEGLNLLEHSKKIYYWEDLVEEKTYVPDPFDFKKALEKEDAIIIYQYVAEYIYKQLTKENSELKKLLQSI